MKIQIGKYAKELWLEYGFQHDDGFQAVCWYNEGDGGFIKWINQLFSKKGISKRYFIFRCYYIKITITK